MKKFFVVNYKNKDGEEEIKHLLMTVEEAQLLSEKFTSESVPFTIHEISTSREKYEPSDVLFLDGRLERTNQG